jgi:Zn-dependent metalloprotease
MASPTCSRSPHRHSIFCLVPPHVLRNIAKNGNAHQRESALDTLALDQTARATRLTSEMQIEGARALALPSLANPTVPPKPNRSIYDARQSEHLPGTLARGEGQGKSKDVAVNEAYDGLGATFNFYLKAYGRVSIDNAGMPLSASVHYGTKYDNAFWDGRQMIFGDGDGVLFNRFTIAVDVIGHELTHGVTGHEVNLRYLGQAGALNESMSDVFGSMIKQYAAKQTVDRADWLIGAGLLAGKGRALRDMAHPGTAYDDRVMGKDPQPAEMQDYVHTSQDNGGVHINSGIPNRAFYMVATALGGYAWERAGRVWYETLRDPRLKPTATFADFAIRTVINATTLFGSASPERAATLEAWQTVGVQIPVRKLFGVVLPPGEGLESPRLSQPAARNAKMARTARMARTR